MQVIVVSAMPTTSTSEELLRENLVRLTQERDKGDVGVVFEGFGLGHGARKAVEDPLT